MTQQDVLRLLEEMLACTPNTLTAELCLRDVDGWDSLATLSFIALADKHFRLPLPGNRVAACKTVGDLLALLEPALRDRAA